MLVKDETTIEKVGINGVDATGTAFRGFSTNQKVTINVKDVDRAGGV